MYRERSASGMEFKYRAVDKQALPSGRHQAPSGYSYSAEQAIRAGYTGRGIRQNNEYFQNPVLVQEAIQRELEKERIREEIIASEIAWSRRRALEAEVRREMMIERELALCGRGRDGFDRFSLQLGAGRRFEPMGFSFEQPDGQSFEDRIAMSLQERLGWGARHEISRQAIVPFQQRSMEPKISEVKNPTSEVSQEKEKMVLLAKSDVNLSGAKRKAVTLPEGGSELRSTGLEKKKVKEEWSCALCQVSATSECCLNAHIQGKKHKSKEAALRAKRNGKNFGIGLCPKKTAILSKLGETIDNSAILSKLGETIDNSSSEQGLKSAGISLEPNQIRESRLQIIPNGKSPKENDVQVLQGVTSADNSRNKSLDKDQKNANKQQRFTFWCQMCQVGAFCETVMEAHRKGKKHMARLQEASQNIVLPTPEMGNMGANDADESTKSGHHAFENFDGALAIIKMKN